MVLKDSFCGYDLYRIRSKELQVSVMTLGATVTSLQFLGQEMTLGYSSAKEYLAGTYYIGAIVGRYANRIAGARFDLNGKTVEVAPNENGNQLHGGPNAFDRQVWQAEVIGENAVRFDLHSPDGENGYPGNLSAWVTYSVEGDRLRIDFEGESDQDTLFAPTTHMYFSLGSEEGIWDAKLQINADRYLAVDEQLIPAGEPLPARDTFDFRQLRPIRGDYDHCFILCGQDACRAEKDGVRMELKTDFPALQLYTGGGLTGVFRKNQGFAIEPEYLPDSPNRPEFPSAVLKKGEHFHKFVEYRFFKD